MTDPARTTWAIAGCAVGGALLGLQQPAPAIPIGVVVAALAARRRPVVALSLLVAGAACLNAARLATSSGELERRAAGVPICSVAATVSAHSGLGTLVRVESLACSGRGRPVDGEAIIDGQVGEPGGTLSGRARLVPLERAGFDASRRAAGAEIELQMLGSETGRPRRPALVAAALLRNSVREAASSLDERRSALLAGLTIGDTSGFDPQLESSMKNAGLSHLVAVSGSNVAMVLAAVMFLVAPLGRIGAAVLAGFVLLLYVLVVGPEPSVLRAAAMGTIGLVAIVAGRRSEPLTALGLAIAAVAFLHPRLLGAVGLHLSAAATAGLIMWSRPIAVRLPLPRPLALVAAVTIAAQLAVTPILVAVFGEISSTSLVANVLAAPAVPPATLLGLAAGMAELIFEPLGALLATLAGPFLGWILAVGEWFGGPSWSRLELPQWMAWPLGVCLVLLAARTLRARAAVT